MKNIIFDISYFYKRLESNSQNNNKWTVFSIINEYNISKKTKLLSTWSYLFSKNEDLTNNSESLITFDFLRDINNYLFIKIGIQLYKIDEIKLYPFLSLKYKI